MLDLNLIKPNDLWYVIGLIVADGNLSKDGRHINITSKDTKLLEHIKICLFLENKICYKSRGGNKIKKYAMLQFGDVKFYKYLLSIGITPNKSLTLKQLHVPNEFFRDFVRGVIDGDGCIHTWKNNCNNYQQWALRIYSGAEEFAMWLKYRMEQTFSVKGKIYSYNQKLSKNKINIIKFGKLATQVILSKIYYADCLSLNRKQALAIDCLETLNGFKNYANVITTVRPSAGTGIQD